MRNGVSRSSRETQRIARQTLHACIAAKKRPIILALEGDLGSGKTTFVQGLAKYLSIREKIQSPTFVLAKWYQLPKRFRPLRHFVHIDAYRLEGLREAREIGLPAIIRDREAVAAIEWADRIRKLVPRSATWIRFRHGARPQERSIKLESGSKN